jgi:hypothetical protein
MPTLYVDMAFGRNAADDRVLVLCWLGACVNKHRHGISGGVSNQYVSCVGGRPSAFSGWLVICSAIAVKQSLGVGGLCVVARSVHPFHCSGVLWLLALYRWWFLSAGGFSGSTSAGMV